MRSGIGPRAELEALGIESVADLAGVGRNLIDHVLVAVVANPRPGVPHDPRVTNPVGIRYTASGSNEFNDMQMYVITYFDKSALVGSSIDLPFPCVAVVPGLQRPRARGRVSLRSADPSVPAVIELNYFGDPEDTRRMVDGVRIAWRLMNSRRFAPTSRTSSTSRVRSLIPIAPLPTSYATIAAPSFIRSARRRWAGFGQDAVVDQYCCVRGVEGLRVVDASVRPNIVRANTT